MTRRGKEMSSQDLSVEVLCILRCRTKIKVSVFAAGEPVFRLPRNAARYHRGDGKNWPETAVREEDLVRGRTTNGRRRKSDP